MGKFNFLVLRFTKWDLQNIMDCLSLIMVCSQKNKAYACDLGIVMW